MKDERADFLRALAKHRNFLRFTVQGLSDEQAASTPTASALCLGGLIKHVTDVERTWIRFIAEGPSAHGSLDDFDVEEHANSFKLLPGETVDGVLAEYAKVARGTEAFVSNLDNLDAVQPLPEAPWFEKTSWSARRVLLHLIAETAQHAGHADIIRETIDGQQTMG